MKTTVYYLGKGKKEDEEALKKAGQILRESGLVAFPTETVYGLGGDALNPESARKIYEAKGRPSDNPLIIHICQWEAMDVLAAEIPKEARQLAEVFWPGPLTMILKKSNRVPPETTGGLDTVAVRMPSDPTALELIRRAGGFVAAPSANRSGRPSPTNPRFVIEDLEGRVDMILAGSDSTIGLESTIVDLTEPVPLILRPGYVTLGMLQKILGKVKMDPGLEEKDSKEPPKAPGMRYRHYAPVAELVIVRGDTDRTIKKIREIIEKAKTERKKTGIICVEETRAEYTADSIKIVGARADEQTIAHRLYRILREFDEEGVEVICSEAFSRKGMGQAVMNRLIKASGYRIIEV